MMGVKSQGMLCSAFNIGWLESEAGVLVELPEDSPLGEQCPSQPPQACHVSLLMSDHLHIQTANAFWLLSASHLGASCAVPDCAITTCCESCTLIICLRLKSHGWVIESSAISII